MSGDLIVKGIGALLLIGLMAIEAFPCRPLRTEDCGTTPHGRPALELSIEAGMERNDADCMLCSVFNYGLSHNWDAGIEIPVIYFNPDIGTSQSGIGDMVLRSKYRFIEETPSQPAFLVKPTFKIPNGDETKGLGSGKSDAGVLLALTKGFGSLVGHFNLGYNMVDLPKGNKLQDNSVFLGLGFQYLLGKRFNLLGEIIYEPIFNADNTFDSIIGIIWNATEKTAYDLAVRFNLTDNNTDHLIIGGLTLNF
ncbi:MAG TPA: hypothetical protein VJC37_05830 [Planctomycetota bacterium]|nr:hypothetical protein [Planctomycetota bacterium]